MVDHLAQKAQSLSRLAPLATGNTVVDALQAILRRPVLFMVGLYGGGNRYDIHFETVADFSHIPAGGREAAVHAAMARYVELLEKYCHAAPSNWFNFFDFWQPPAVPHLSP